VPAAWAGLGSAFALLGASLLLCGLVLVRPGAQPPVWLLCVLAAGQIKYGVWTITAWALFWRNTAALFGAPIISAESVVMTLSHVALVAQGLVLFAVVRPTGRGALGGALATLLWFGLSDVVDYWPLIDGQAWHPAVPPIIPLRVLQRTMLVATGLLAAALAAAGLLPSAQAGRNASRPAHAAGRPGPP
jgi:uncharacterized membrane protein YpjA